ncbi:glycosyltransferase [Phaeovulum vinaykumarii]|uniref:Glycosyltransferase involved in cell wall bisynthesis n=1 Tax=Phaeovulum vinaykumarii TaxID=407234 RepID=A0A1N7ML06_9RHOB|nr:glycosyltransferase [Phaeovulum vinaykumarii]SIS86783.1 Glycosyltransferase involved in cell wall bisynthesis [Phaeovulum vinaykumarii]SOC13425.1 glycosyltransferase involved in cell wall bisynthesis [Phaeovulum vinaykumarii]
MKILFVHQNFPGQFPHLAPALAQRGHEVLALTAESNNRPSPVKVVKYRNPEKVTLSSPLTRLYAESAERGMRAALAARTLRDRHGYVPDVIVGHSGWGETLFLKEVWPEAKLIVYAELMYQTTGLDTDFDPEFARDNLGSRISTTARAAHLIQSMVQADAGLSPTEFQAATFPPELRAKITVIHDGIDTDRLTPDPSATLEIPGGHTFRVGDEVLSFVNRSLEPYRGYHSFMRALPGVMAARPEAHVVIIGDEGQSYGAAPKDGISWKQRFLTEVQDRIDMSRLHFLGRVPYPTYVKLLHVARVHAYLTYPFVLSWSLMESLGAGALVVASDTGPVREMIRDGENGRLVDFFDIEGWSRVLTECLAEPERFAPLRGAARDGIRATYDLKRVCLPKLVDFVENAGR